LVAATAAAVADAVPAPNKDDDNRLIIVSFLYFRAYDV
jgi:serine protease inhibitor